MQNNEKGLRAIRTRPFRPRHLSYPTGSDDDVDTWECGRERVGHLFVCLSNRGETKERPLLLEAMHLLLVAF